MSGKRKKGNPNQRRPLESKDQVDRVKSIISIITLNINGLNIPIKNRWSDWIKKEKLYTFYKNKIQDR